MTKCHCCENVNIWSFWLKVCLLLKSFWVFIQKNETHQQFTRKTGEESEEESSLQILVVRWNSSHAKTLPFSMCPVYPVDQKPYYLEERTRTLMTSGNWIEEGNRKENKWQTPSLRKGQDLESYRPKTRYPAPANDWGLSRKADDVLCSDLEWWVQTRSVSGKNQP